jgi:isopenicillin-N epimerase
MGQGTYRRVGKIEIRRIEIARDSNVDWKRIRDSIEMDPTQIYLNTGTSGLLPKLVHQRAAALREALHHNPTREAWREPWKDVWISRTRLAEHLGTAPDRLIFFTNVSHAINTFCLSVDLPPGSEILVSDHEYGSMRMAWDRASQRRGWQIRNASLPIHSENPADYVQAIESQMTTHTRLLYLSHILYGTGHILPIEEIIARARRRGILVFIDGAHGPGMLPLNLSHLGAHFYAANLHKWFLAPVGAAFLFVEKGMEQHLEPWQVSWAYLDDRSRPDEPNEFGSTPWLRQFEMEGTRDMTPWRVVHLCCDFHDSLPHAARRARLHALGERVRDSLEGVSGMDCITPQNPILRGGLTSFVLPASVDGNALRQALWDHHRIEVNLIELGGVQYLRVSTHVYNNEEEIAALERAVHAEL